MYPSIFSNIISGRTPDAVAAKTRAYGLRSVQFVPDEVNVGWGFDGNGASGPFEVWADAYDRAGVEICGVAGYLNLLPLNEDKRKRNIDTFVSFLRRMKTLGCRYISTETGSLSPRGDWTADPANRTEWAWQELLKITRGLVEVAAAEDVVILYEPYIANICNTPELGAQFVREIDSPHLAILMDPTNWFTNELAEPEQVGTVLERGFAALGGLFRLAHAKDVTPPAAGEEKPGLPGPGQGILDYPRYLQLLAQYGYDGALVMEHLPEADIPAALAFVQEMIDRHASRREPPLRTPPA
jgi:sugar phosphate isomerase/epimerase